MVPEPGRTSVSRRVTYSSSSFSRSFRSLYSFWCINVDVPIPDFFSEVLLNISSGFMSLLAVTRLLYFLKRALSESQSRLVPSMYIRFPSHNRSHERSKVNFLLGFFYVRPDKTQGACGGVSVLSRESCAVTAQTWVLTCPWVLRRERRPRPLSTSTLRARPRNSRLPLVGRRRHSYSFGPIRRLSTSEVIPSHLL